MIFILLGIIFSSSALFAQSNVNGRLFSSSPSISLVNNQPKVHTPKTVIETGESSAKQLISEDLYITGGLGLGDDMVDNTVLGFATIMIMENNIQLLFDDTSASAEFPSNDWAITINETANGGDNCFMVEDVTAGAVPFKIMADAGDNALFVDDNGRVGFGTPNPEVELHIADGDSPAVRLDQDGSSGWTAQKWDVAGNEVNFFVRDVTGGSTLPFRIAAGAPSDVLTLKETGYVGIGTWDPITQLDVKGNVNIDSTLFLSPMTEESQYPLEGAIYMDGNEHLLKVHNGTDWVSIDDSQDLVDATLTGTILEIEIENGASVSVDLQPLVQDLEDRIAALETLVSGKASVKYSSARLFQNAPNPYKNSTTINYYIPETVENAVLKITSVDGTSVKDMVIYNRGEGSVVLDGIETAKGTYFYSLIIDGQKLETKTLVKVD